MRFREKKCKIHPWNWVETLPDGSKRCSWCKYKLTKNDVIGINYEIQQTAVTSGSSGENKK